MKTFLQFFMVTLVAFICLPLHAQYAAVGYGKKTGTPAGTTYAVLTGYEKYDALLKTYLPVFWKHTAVDFIEKEALDRNIGNTGSYFITFVLVTKNVSSSAVNYNNGLPESPGAMEASYYCLALIRGGRKSIDRYQLTDFLAYCPLDYLRDENMVTRCYYRLPIMLYQLANTFSLINEKQLSGKNEKLEKKLEQIYNTQKQLVKRKTLLVLNEQIMPMKEDEFAKIYPYAFEYCTKEKLAELIRKKDNRYLFYLPCNKTSPNQFIFDLETYECIYAKSHHSSRYMLREKDLENMVEDLKE